MMIVVLVVMMIILVIINKKIKIMEQLGKNFFIRRAPRILFFIKIIIQYIYKFLLSIYMHTPVKLKSQIKNDLNK